MSSLPVPKAQHAAALAPAAALAVRVVMIPEHGIAVPPEAHTLAGFRAWAKSEAFPERGSISFLDQEIFIDMSPEELETHAKVKMEIYRAAANLNAKMDLGEFYPDGTLLTNVEANLSTEADGTFVLWESLEAGKVRLIPREGEEGEYMEVEGTPDCVMEIVSKYSVQKDTRHLREQYHRAGIPEYWLLDARGREIVFQILVRGENDYVATATRSGWQASPVFGRRFRLVRRRGRLNHWKYTLQLKPLR